MAYTTVDDPTAYFNTLLYTGNGASSRDLTFSANAGDFQADWLWFKQRSQASRSNNVYDSVRGNSQRIETDNNGAEEEQTGLHKTFNTNGFTIGAGNIVNENSQTFVTWGWKAGTSFTNDASATGIGSLDSSGSVNEEAGFAIVSYTGNETASTLKHGLSTVPQVIIVKGRVAARDWIVGHHTQAWTTSAMLNETTAYSNQTHWNNTAPTSSVFTIEGGTNSNVNTNSAAYIAYVFSERQGYSKFGSYTGNGSTDGTFVYTGFKPAFFMIKNASAASYWTIFDNKRSSSGGSNEIDYSLDANVSNAEETGTSVNDVDFLSNGIKIREDNGDLNASGGTIIYMAFAENPFVTSSGVPATAR